MGERAARCTRPSAPGAYAHRSRPSPRRAPPAARVQLPLDRRLVDTRRKGALGRLWVGPMRSAAAAAAIPATAPPQRGDRVQPLAHGQARERRRLRGRAACDGREAALAQLRFLLLALDLMPARAGVAAPGSSDRGAQRSALGRPGGKRGMQACSKAARAQVSSAPGRHPAHPLQNLPLERLWHRQPRQPLLCPRAAGVDWRPPLRLLLRATPP